MAIKIKILKLRNENNSKMWRLNLFTTLQLIHNVQ